MSNTNQMSRKMKIFWGVVIALAALNIFVKLTTPDKPSNHLTDYEKGKAEQMGRTDYYLENN